MDKLTCTDNGDSGKSEDKFRRFSSSKIDSHYLDVKLKISKKDDRTVFRMLQNPTMGEPDFNQFMRLRKQLAIGTENFRREEHLSPVLIPTMSIVMDEQLKLVQKVFDIVERANRKICVFSVTMLMYSKDKLWSFFCSYPNICKEGGWREVSTNCRFEIKTWRFYLSPSCKYFGMW